MFWDFFKKAQETKTPEQTVTLKESYTYEDIGELFQHYIHELPAVVQPVVNKIGYPPNAQYHKRHLWLSVVGGIGIIERALRLKYPDVRLHPAALEVCKKYADRIKATEISQEDRKTDYDVISKINPNINDTSLFILLFLSKGKPIIPVLDWDDIIKVRLYDETIDVASLFIVKRYTSILNDLNKAIQQKQKWLNAAVAYK